MGLRYTKYKGHEGKCVMWRFVVCTFAKYISGVQINQHGMDGACDTYGANGKMHTGIWLENMGERGNFEDLRVKRIITLKGIVRTSFGKAWIGLMWLRVWATNRLL